MTRVAVVAGGGEHTGPAVALRLAAGGFDVALLGSEFTSADKTVRRVEEYGRQCVTVRAELTDARSVAVAFGRVRTALSGPAVLVTCVGPQPMPDGLPEDESADEQRYTAVRRALRPAFVCCQAGAGQLLRHRWGRIIIVTEPADADGNTWRTSRPVLDGLIGFTRSAALELARTGTTVNLVAPADRAADSRAPAHRAAGDDSAASYADGVAHVTEFLVDERAVGITGQAIRVAARADVPLLRER
ncbi:short-chain dehydrogenase/reductase family protein NovK [Streptomyces niveus]|uniref:short-chain dehydrogenase/reductase family protein NovK n=1 Tax=Streptomyces niveus TaxID=193462 RepID=UPI0033CF9D25